MKHFHVNPILRVLLLVCLLLAAVPTAVFAYGGGLFINTAESPVEEELSALYAMDASGQPVPLSSAPYAITADGTEQLVTAEPELTPAPEADVSPVPSTSPEVSPEPAPTITPEPTPVVTPEPPYDDVLPAYDVMKIGLNYGKSAVIEAGLQNVVGSGFSFGYFDRNREFHEVGSTTETAITMTADLNITTQSGHTLGCWHILLPKSSQSFAEAQARADAIGGFPAYYSGSYFVLYGQYTSKADAEAARVNLGMEGTAYSGSQRCMTVSRTGTDKILFKFDWGTDYDLAVRPISQEQQAITRYGENQYYGDFQFARLSNNENITVVNYVGIEEYTKGVVPHEMYASWPLEALKAQALCARNYAVTNFNRYRSHGFDLTADIYSQVYQGVGSGTPETDRAVEETAGQYIRYEGAICQTFFFSSDGGATESSENVWGTAVPYLKGVVDPYEADVNTYFDHWTYELKLEQLQTMLNEKFGINMGLITTVECIRTDMDNVKAIVFTDEDGKTYTVRGSRSSYAVDANSLRFDVEKKDDVFVVTGSGWGHNCGMSQYGALSMAEHHGKTAEEIIKFYYTGVYIR